MQTTNTFPRTPARVRRTEQAIEDAARAMRGPIGERLTHIAAAVRATPPHRAPVVIATVEGRVILQWLEAAS